MQKLCFFARIVCATGALLSSTFCCAGSTQSVIPESFTEWTQDSQQIDIERTLGDATPERMLICIDRHIVASLHKGEHVRVYLRPTRPHDLYLVTRGGAICDVNQVVTVVEIPTETPIWKVGVAHDNTIKLLDGMRR